MGIWLARMGDLAWKKKCWIGSKERAKSESESVCGADMFGNYSTCIDGSDGIYVGNRGFCED